MGKLLARTGVGALSACALMWTLGCGSDSGGGGEGFGGTSSGGSGGTISSGGTTSGGSAGGGTTSSGGTSAGGMSSGGSAGGGTTSSGGSGGSGGATSSGGSGGSSSSAPDCSGDELSEGLLGSCDTRSVTGASQGQCRDWYGDSGPDLSVSCNGLSGTFSASESCPIAERVGRCVLGEVLGAQAVYNYYSSDYSASAARAHCGSLDGCMLVASEIQLERAGAGSGEIAITPGMDVCGASTSACLQSVLAGDSITLEAKPDLVSTFEGWEGGGCGTDPVCVVTAGGPDSITARFAQPGLNTSYHYVFGSAHQNGDSINALILGPSGELYMSARVWNQVDVGGQLVGDTLFTDFIGRFEPSSDTLVWFHDFSGPLRRTPSGSLLVAINDVDTGDPVTVGGQTFEFATPTVLFLELDSATGALLSSRSVDLDGGRIRYFELAANGDILAMGTKWDGNARDQIIALRLAAAGASVIWNQLFVDNGEFLRLLGFAVDAAGDLYSVGEYRSSMNFGGDWLDDTAERDFFALKLSGADGSHLWSIRLGDGGFLGDVEIDGSGALFAAGLGYVKRLDPADGTEMWSVAGPWDPGLAVDSDGNLLATGRFSGSRDEPGGKLVSRGGWDVRVSKLEPNTGSELWLKTIGGNGNGDTIHALPVATDDFYLYGGYAGRLELPDGTVLQHTGGNNDAFLARVVP